MTAQVEMPQYQCHKKVWALKIKAVERGAITLLHFEEPGYAPVSVSYSWDTKYEPEAGGYYVVYEDGYASVSPAATFESGYTRI